MSLDLGSVKPKEVTENTLYRIWMKYYGDIYAEKLKYRVEKFEIKGIGSTFLTVMP